MKRTARKDTTTIPAASPRPDTGRLLIVSNRLPVTAHLERGAVRIRTASGGLATGLRGWYEGRDTLWIGWPGDVSAFDDGQRADLERRLAKRQASAVYLTTREVTDYYEGFANRVLWPLFHYLLDRVPIDAAGWDAYRTANEKFAAAVIAQYRPGDTIWVHDYQLMLVPALLRRQLPYARIGYFLHIPFPSSEVFRILPWRRELLTGLLGADLIGFHTFAYLRHFMTSLVHVMGVEANVDSLEFEDRHVQLGVFPMGIDARTFDTLARDADIEAQVSSIREGAGGRRIVLGVDRLDYTKGIPTRLLAVERLLARHPELRDTVRYIQVAVPSRGMVDSYQKFRVRVEELVGRINGSSGTLTSTPVHYMHRSLSLRQLIALYRAADVMLVTPLRDGMNLVAKEFVASRVDETGVLVLSEFAGSAAELGDALVINPYDVEATADTIFRALELSPNEQRLRMRRLRTRVMTFDVHQWASAFETALRAATPGPREVRDAMAPRVLARCRDAQSLALLLDYDGTLVPLASTPEEAVPDEELLRLLRRLAARPGLDLHIVSGRMRESLSAFLDSVPATLWAEHGFWHRPMGHATWSPAGTLPVDWMQKVLPILEQFTTTTPGSRIEHKGASVAWHYRLADPEFGERQAHELRMLFGDALSNQPLEVIEGHKVIEIRFRGVNKGQVVHQILASQAHDLMVAIGDDRTDEDLFAALPDSAVAIAVGRVESRARFRLGDWEAVRLWLQQLLG
ncbi:MAG: bifunctional alpha,alpha-trehalose-phosphate synthase (UDP-forming)/trehalose-phosphatase [Vicinamibacterales bacterium]